MAARRRGFGKVRRLPSGRWQASYVGPDGARHNAPATFSARVDADGWLSVQQSQIVRDAWLPPAAPAEAPAAPPTLAEYAAGWLDRDLSPSTRRVYRGTLAVQILPAFGGTPLPSITPAAVREWHAALARSTGPRQRAAAYSTLRAIMNTALADDLIASNPCRIRGAGRARRAREIRPATLGELDVITDAMPPRLRLMVLLAAWCGLRFGELAELRRPDLDLAAGVIRVRRGVVQADGGGWHVKGPKSDAGSRDVAIPPHLIPVAAAHLSEHAAPGPGGLLFPAASAAHLSAASLYAAYRPAREAAGRPDLRFHDLRHTGATLAAATGATIADLMRRLGHSTPAAAMIYQHAADDRDATIAAALSDFHTAKVVPLRPRRRAN